MTKRKFEKGKGYVPEWYVPYPSEKVNQHFTNGGIPSGAVMQIQSDGEGTFKTTSALQIAKGVQELGYDIAYIDAENALFNSEDENGYEINDWFDRIGLNMAQTYIIPCDTQEQLWEDIKELITEHNVKFVILDSIHAMQPGKIHENNPGDSVIGLQAKINGIELVKITRILREHHATICGINHKKEVITNQGSMGKKAVGGKGWGFYSQLIIVNRRSTAKSKLEGNDFIDLEVYIEKNKFGASFINNSVKVKQGVGITPDFDLLEAAMKKKLIVKKGAGWYRWTPIDEAIAQGDEQIMDWVAENRELIREGLS